MEGIRMIGMSICVTAAATSLFSMLIYYRVRKPVKSKAEILEELKKENKESSDTK